MIFCRYLENIRDIQWRHSHHSIEFFLRDHSHYCTVNKLSSRKPRISYCFSSETIIYSWFSQISTLNSVCAFKIPKCSNTCKELQEVRSSSKYIIYYRVSNEFYAIALTWKFTYYEYYSGFYIWNICTGWAKLDVSALWKRKELSCWRLTEVHFWLLSYFFLLPNERYDVINHFFHFFTHSWGCDSSEQI